ncbi:MAG TPA: hypothetical protein VFT74_10360, partial [Isosphaeraceae bacterium]|nr:hypothetical protein [Isosphaeraceae bacterium]
CGWSCAKPYVCMAAPFIEYLLLPCRDVARSLAVYTGVLGFTSRPGPGDVVELTQAGAEGGGIRLLQTDGDPVPAATLDHTGPYGMTIYTTQFDSVMAELGDAAGSEPVGISYTFPGTDTLVREGRVPGPDGVNVFLVEYDESRHRCRLTGHPEHRVSEIAAVGFVVDDIEGAISNHESELGASTYMNAKFDGPSVERMNGLYEGAELHVAFLRGVNPGNARLELLQRARTTAPAPGPVAGVRVVCRVPPTVSQAPISLVPGVFLDRIPA